MLAEQRKGGGGDVAAEQYDQLLMEVGLAASGGANAASASQVIAVRARGRRRVCACVGMHWVVQHSFWNLHEPTPPPSGGIPCNAVYSNTACRRNTPSCRVLA